jgi:PadR family transcriptional regulator, regulatory protein PadR
VTRETQHRDEIPRGTLDMLILRTLAGAKEMHGFEIADSIQETSESVLNVEEGSLYPALQRLLLQGWVSAEWGRTDGNRRARYYRLTAAGKKQLEREMEQYHRLSRAIVRILQPV